MFNSTCEFLGNSETRKSLFRHISRPLFGARAFQSPVMKCFQSSARDPRPAFPARGGARRTVAHRRPLSCRRRPRFVALPVGCRRSRAGNLVWVAPAAEPGTPRTPPPAPRHTTGELQALHEDDELELPAAWGLLFGESFDQNASFVAQLR